MHLHFQIPATRGAGVAVAAIQTNDLHTLKPASKACRSIFTLWLNYFLSDQFCQDYYCVVSICTISKTNTITFNSVVKLTQWTMSPSTHHCRHCPNVETALSSNQHQHVIWRESRQIIFKALLEMFAVVSMKKTFF